MQNRLTNSQRYLVNAKPGTTIALTLLTLMVTVSGNPNPTYPTNRTNPTTKYLYLQVQVTLLLNTVVNLSTYSAYMPSQELNSFLPRCMQCRRGLYSDENSVRLSVRL